MNLDATSSSSGASVTSLTWSHTCGASANILIVEESNVFNVGAPNASGVTYNGVALTLAPGSQGNSGVSGNTGATSIWYLINPTTGSAQNIIVTYPGQTYSACGAISFSGANTSTPVGTSSQNSTSGNSSGTSPATATATGGGTNDVYIGAMGTFTTAYTSGSANGQVSRWNQMSVGGVTAGGGDTIPGANTGAFSWTFSGSSAWNASAAVFFGAPSGPTINTQPASQSVYVGQTATFTVSATTSGGSLSYQWQQYISGSWTNVGTNSTSYTTGATGYADNGDLFQVLVTDSNGTTTSATAVLTVIGVASVAWLQ